MIATRVVEITDTDFSDPACTWHWFLECVNRVPGLTVLGGAHHVFPGGGLTGCIIIGESHAAIHTWPEREADHARS
jgi:S-adenosylmethionine/arginine decarboxylase-like enzyme